MVNARFSEVRLWNNVVGTVYWSDENIGYFQFSDSFVKRGIDIAPLTMPLEKFNSTESFFFPHLNIETFKGLPGMLADSLPDRFGTSILDSWLNSQGRNKDSLNPVERLCYTGKRGMGALEFEPVLGSNKQNSFQVDISEIVDLANNVLNDKASIHTNIVHSSGALSKILHIGTSAGGARPKAVIAINRETGDIRSGQVDAPKGYSHWIIKLDGVREGGPNSSNGYGNIEFAYFKMALDCGLKISNCDLITENGRNHFITQRFDRIGNEKLHMQSLCAMAHLDFNTPHTHSYEQAFQVMRELRLPYPDAEQLFKVMVFNVIAINCDDHTKNISFLMDKNGKWSLAPAFDISYAFDANSYWIKEHQMSVNGKWKNISEEDILLVAKRMNIKAPKEIIERIKHCTSNWLDYAKDCGVNPEKATKIDNLIVENKAQFFPNTTKIIGETKDVKVETLRVPGMVSQNLKKKDKGPTM